MENMNFGQAPKKKEEAQDSEQKEKKNPFDLTEEEMAKIFSGNDNRDMYKN